MFELTKKADYAIRLMVEVASAGEETLTTHEVSQREDIPYQFLRKVVQELVGAGLLTSSRGRRGGLALAHPAQTISLLEIVRAIEEPAVSQCVIDPGTCTRRNRCVVYPVWRRLQREMEAAMERVLLAELAERHAATGRAIGHAREGAERPAKETPDVSFRREGSAINFEVAPERRVE